MVMSVFATLVNAVYLCLIIVGWRMIQVRRLSVKRASRRMRGARVLRFLIHTMIKKATKGLVACAVILGIISPGAIIAKTPSITKAGANVTLAATDHYDMADGSNVMTLNTMLADNGQGQTEYSIDSGQRDG